MTSDVAHHSYDDRIGSHLLICWLALLLVRIAEVEIAMCWAVVRRTMPRLHFGEFLNERNRVLRHTALTAEQTNIRMAQEPRLTQTIARQTPIGSAIAAEHYRTVRNSCPDSGL